MTAALIADPSFSRPTWAEISPSALRHNATVLRRALETPLLCVIKANAYGHGAQLVAQTLEPLRDDHNAPLVSCFGVASVDEGIALREAGIGRDILILSALLPEEAACAARHELMPTLWEPNVARALNDAAKHQNKTARAHFKIDTGMNRLGVSWREAKRAWCEVSTLSNVRVTGVYTHFACADDAPDSMTETQVSRFHDALRNCQIPPELTLHAANSAGALRYPDARFDWSRVGLALFGVRPGDVAPNVELQPVMTWRSRVTSVRQLSSGDTLSYGATWTARRDSRIAIVPVGYADGYPRRLGNVAQVVINGARFPVVGRVTMDQLMVDVTNENVQIGDGVELWGETLRVEEVATWAETIPYELLCGVGARVPRVVNPR